MSSGTTYGGLLKTPQTTPTASLQRRCASCAPENSPTSMRLRKKTLTGHAVNSMIPVQGSEADRHDSAPRTRRGCAQSAPSPGAGQALPPSAGRHPRRPAAARRPGPGPRATRAAHQARPHHHRAPAAAARPSRTHCTARPLIRSSGIHAAPLAAASGCDGTPIRPAGPAKRRDARPLTHDTLAHLHPAQPYTSVTAAPAAVPSRRCMQVPRGRRAEVPGSPAVLTRTGPEDAKALAGR